MGDTTEEVSGAPTYSPTSGLTVLEDNPDFALTDELLEIAREFGMTMKEFGMTIKELLELVVLTFLAWAVIMCMAVVIIWGVNHA